MESEKETLAAAQIVAVDPSEPANATEHGSSLSPVVESKQQEPVTIASHLDEIARSLKVPEGGETAVAPPTSGVRIGAGLKRGRRGVEDDKTAAKWLLEFHTNLSDSGSDDNRDVERPGVAPPASDTGAGTGSGTGVRRSQRRGALNGGMNPAVAAALAVEGSDTDDENAAKLPVSGARGRNGGSATVPIGLPAPAAPVVAAATEGPRAASGPQQIASILPAITATAAPAPTDTPALPAEVMHTSGGMGGVSSIQKSELTLLCERFQHQFGHLQPDGSPQLLMLNDVAEALGVPRRRLYDVINVFESIEVMRRVGKLMYEFCGYDHLPELLGRLAMEEEGGLPVEDRIRRAPTAPATATGTATTGTAAASEDTSSQQASNRTTSHSLWVLSRRLVRMLLKSDGPIALTGAAAILVGPAGVADPSQHRSQTQITVERRLYDIGSILCSLGLVERVYVKKRQPAFAWVYGWRPGDVHQPPELEVAIASRQPAPPLTLAPRRTPEDATTSNRSGRRGGRGNNKRQKADPSAAGGLAGLQGMAALHGGMLNPAAAFGIAAGFPGMNMNMNMLPPMMPASAAAAAAAMQAMPGLMLPDGTMDKSGGQALMAQYFATQPFFNPMALGFNPMPSNAVPDMSTAAAAAPDMGTAGMMNAGLPPPPPLPVPVPGGEDGGVQIKEEGEAGNSGADDTVAVVGGREGQDPAAMAMAAAAAGVDFPPAGLEGVGDVGSVHPAGMHQGQPDPAAMASMMMWPQMMMHPAAMMQQFQQQQTGGGAGGVIPESGQTEGGDAAAAAAAANQFAASMPFAGLNGWPMMQPMVPIAQQPNNAQPQQP